ncbi:ribosome maturation factor RimM [Streptomyces hoynatensis]|uniref:Ribosome maturation factor RimM n=1 Tax=Streptomyces hoynatensis TaxID=1141874 RepID=A0A3A9YU56_9ACTN|nr:ribosome maturation factor RimM [Streptomyces hoynatensis]RKN38786.1 ribosome maturation factor RimM [Streptomyces hoynatensis]
MHVVVARIGRAHGIRGEVSVEVRTDEPETRLAPGAVLGTEPASAGPLTIASGRVHSGRLLLRFEGVTDRTAAEALRNTLLVAEVDPGELPEDPEEFYDHQLVGLEVVTEEGRRVGTIGEIAHLPSQDLLIVARPEGGEAMIPFVAELVPEIDLPGRRVVVAPPPGLLEEPEGAGPGEPGAEGTPGDRGAAGEEG